MKRKISASNLFWTLVCNEKLKNAKSNNGYSYLIAPQYIETEKTRFFDFEIFQRGGWLPKKNF